MPVSHGFRRDADFRAAKNALAAFPIVGLVGPALAVSSAQNYRQLRARGVTVRKTIDCLIATYCLANDITLLHDDQDFEPFATQLGLATVMV